MAVGDVLGGPVTAWNVADGGFSPGFAGRVETAGGRRAFVKAMSRSAQPGWVFLYEREAAIAASLPPDPPFPELLGTVDDGDWVGLVFGWIDGSAPTLPWRDDEVARVVDALHTMAAAATPAPGNAAAAGEMWGPWFSHWADIATDPARVAALEPPCVAHLDELGELDRLWPAAVAGDALVHLDVRHDNLVLTPVAVFLVDWAFGARAAPWVDLVCLLPGVAADGGPDPESVWRADPWHDCVDPDGFDAFLAAWAGMLTYFSALPGGALPEALRRVHDRQARAARAWLARRRGWADQDVS